MSTVFCDACGANLTTLDTPDGQQARRCAEADPAEPAELWAGEEDSQWFVMFTNCREENPIAQLDMFGRPCR